MKRKMMYICEMCNKQYFKEKEARECEAKCLGLTICEYLEYIGLLKEEERAYDFVSHTNNQHSRKKYEDKANAVIEFQNKHDITNEIREKIFNK